MLAYVALVGRFCLCENPITRLNNFLSFQEVLKVTRRQLERELSLEDVNRIQDLPAYNLLYRPQKVALDNFRRDLNYEDNDHFWGLFEYPEVLHCSSHISEALKLRVVVCTVLWTLHKITIFLLLLLNPVNSRQTVARPSDYKDSILLINR